MKIEFKISPEPAPDDGEAILAAVRDLLRAYETRARPSAWRISGWTGQRVGATDLAHWLPPERRWPMTARLPWGGREFPGMNGRGDAK